MRWKGYELLVANQQGDTLLKEVKVRRNDEDIVIVLTHTTDAQEAFEQVKALIDKGHFPYQSKLDDFMTNLRKWDIETLE